MSLSFQDALNELQRLRMQLGSFQQMTFGKYKGRSFVYVKTVDFEYTEWVCQLKNPNRNQKMFADWVSSTCTIIHRRDTLAEFFTSPNQSYENDLVGLF